MLGPMNKQEEKREVPLILSIGSLTEHDVRVTTPIKYTKKLDVFRFGECGGSISIRGEKGLTAGGIEVGEETEALRRVQ
jgi:hypothetical protein